ncbi:MAG: hypothetical protein ABW352_22735 [Polyangiales bacterium]
MDESLDQLTELIVIPSWSPARSARRAIILRAARRPSLIVLPDDVGVPNEPSRVRIPPRRPGARSMQLTAFAPAQLATPPA